jgi:putative ABC transport system permease protein
MLLNDLRFAGPQVRKSPAFTAVAVMTLGLCIGANTAIYSVTAGALFAVAIIASLGPALRILRLDPAQTLRDQ